MTHQPNMQGDTEAMLLATALNRGVAEDPSDLASLLDALGPRLRPHFAAHLSGHMEDRGGGRGAVMRALSSLLEDAAVAAARRHGLEDDAHS
jgi:hypothetical protein